MKNLMAIILGLLLLVSAAAAIGNSNVANVAVNDNMAGQVMTNANFVQMSDIDASLTGNLIHADQTSHVDAVDNILTGLKPDDESLFIQSVDQLISDTGNSNIDTQNVGASGSTIIGGINVTGIGSFNAGLIAADNTLTDSISSQVISQSEKIDGNSNVDTQNVGISDSTIINGINVTSIDSFNSGLIAIGNTLTDSISSQAIRQNNTDMGNSNADIQNVGISDSTIIGGINMIGIGSFSTGLTAVGNTMTDSIGNQVISQNDIDMGNSNVDIQNVGISDSTIIGGINVNETGSFDFGLIAVGNTMANSVAIQVTSQNEKIDGNSNVGTQNVGISGSTVIGGINAIGIGSFDSGLIAAGNTMTGSVDNQIIGQSEKIDGNSNMDIQNVGTFGSTIIGAINTVEIGSFDSGLIAVDNSMTDSIASQIISQNDTDIGNTNAVTQIANSIMATDILTKAGVIQDIDENAHSLGNANTISQDEALVNSANTVTSGNIIQQDDVDTSI